MTQESEIHHAFLSISQEQWSALKRLQHHAEYAGSQTNMPRTSCVLSLLAIDAVKGDRTLTSFGHQLRNYGPVCSTFEELRGHAARELAEIADA